MGFAGAGFASFFGFFFSLPCELLPFAMFLLQKVSNSEYAPARGVGFAPTVSGD